MQSFFWLYLTINAPDFRLIPLDLNTYAAKGFNSLHTKPDHFVTVIIYLLSTVDSILSDLSHLLDTDFQVRNRWQS